MTIEDFAWIPAIVEKLETKHNVTQDEVEEVFFNSPRFRFVESGLRENEDVYAATGRTDVGRLLIVFFIRKADGVALIISARNADASERRRHERK